MLVPADAEQAPSKLGIKQDGGGRSLAKWDILRSG
jgi:hypothetical protein